MNISLDTQLPPIFAEASGNQNSWMITASQDNESDTTPAKDGPISYADLTV